MIKPKEKIMKRQIKCPVHSYKTVKIIGNAEYKKCTNCGKRIVVMSDVCQCPLNKQWLFYETKKFGGD